MKTIVWTTQAVCLLGLVILSGCASTISAPSASTRLGASQDQATIQALQKRLQGRERTIAMQNDQIEVLSSQLDALKRIDQDTRTHRRPVSNLLIVSP
jgi:peptidoglycan hydrolase CwlO-like protein